MVKLALFAAVATIAGALAFATISQADNPSPCKHTDFHTQIAKDACAKGGQPAAKKAMQDWVKTVKIDGVTPTCSPKFCHKNLAPNYDLNDDAFTKFKAAGGKMIK